MKKRAERNSLIRLALPVLLGACLIGTACFVIWKVNQDSPEKAAARGWACLETPSDGCLMRMMDDEELTRHQLSKEQAVKLVNNYCLPVLRTGTWTGDPQSVPYPEMKRVISTRELSINGHNVTVGLTVAIKKSGPVLVGSVRQLLYIVWLAKYGDDPPGNANRQGMTKEAGVLASHGLIGLPGVGTDDLWTWARWTEYFEEQAHKPTPNL